MSFPFASVLSAHIPGRDNGTEGMAAERRFCMASGFGSQQLGVGGLEGRRPADSVLGGLGLRSRMGSEEAL